MFHLIALSLFGTLWVGAALRWWLAGQPVPLHDLGAIRHLHTHLGYYGVLFPLMWATWRGLGIHAPRGAVLAFYAAATAASAIGFGLSSYGPLAIAGSTGVLAIWLMSAWGARAGTRRRGGWLATVPLGIALGASLVPLVAANAGGARAEELVRSFLGMLMLGALLPSALARLGGRPFPRLGWLLAAAAAALSLGAVPGVLSAGLLIVGVLIGASALTAPAPLDLRLAWCVAAAGLAAAGLGVVPLSHEVAVAGTHFLVLGPLIVTGWPHRLPAWLRALALVLVGGMCLAILWVQPVAAAITGTGLAVLWTGVLIWSAGVSYPSPG